MVCGRVERKVERAVIEGCGLGGLGGRGGRVRGVALLAVVDIGGVKVVGCGGVVGGGRICGAGRWDMWRS